jgi:hypothetical protein
MTIYEKNIKFISERYPYLLKELNGKSVKGGTDLEICRSRTGLPVFRLTKGDRKVYLNSVYDPELEAKRWAERRSGNEKGSLILCGSGFFYHLKAILNLGDYQKIVCYEPSPAILNASLQEMDLSELKGDYLLLTGNNYNECANLASQYLMYLILDSDWVELPSYQELFPDEINAFQIALRESVRISRANLATANLFGEQWASNAVKNLSAITNTPGVKHFFNQFNGIPAVMVSAGPSLEKNIHLLNDIKDKAVIICAGTSIRAMAKFGVKPHFLVAFDGTDYNKTIYSNLDFEDICLVYNYRFNHYALDYFTGKKVYMKLDMETFSDFLSLKSGYEFGVIRSGFSVAHPTLDFAIKLGCSPVILIGQDLAYTGDKRYAESQYQKVINRNKLPPNCFITKDIFGQDIVTDNQLDSFRFLFELMVSEYYRNKKILNATEGGQPIKGIPNYKLFDLINEYCRKERGISRRIEELYNYGLKEIQRNHSQKINLIDQTKAMAEQGIYKMETLLDQIRRLKQINSSGDVFQSQLNTALNQIADEFGAFIITNEWRLLLKDLQDWKIAPNQIAIANMKKVESKEAYNAKLQHWINIFSETKKYLEFVIKQLADAAKTRGEQEPVPSIVQIANVKTPEQIREAIVNGGALKEIQAQLEAVINQGSRKDLNEYYYLYGLVLYKSKEISKAVLILEHVARQVNNDAKIIFLLYKCYRKAQNYSKTLECLEKCLRLGFKPDFCRRMLVKIAYRSQNYLSANNYAIDLKTIEGEECFYQWIRINCLYQMHLNIEAKTEFQDLITRFKVRKRLGESLATLLSTSVTSVYEKNYHSNRSFFEERSIQPGLFSEVRLKYCKYSDDEYVYDTESKRFLQAINEPCANNLEISTEDTLLICDTDDLSIYKRLKQILQETQVDAAQSIKLTPIFVIEHELENWRMMMQKFDFSELAELQNLHFLIGKNDEKLEELFLDDYVPLPNVLYGTKLDEIKQLIEKIKTKKEKIYQERLTGLQDFYRENIPKRLNKVLIFTSSKEKLLFNYGKALNECFRNLGLECEISYESPPYFKFNKYADLNLLDRFRPDLVVHLFAVAEELEAYQNLCIPFVNWRIIDHWLLPELTSKYQLEKVMISGASDVNSGIIRRGFLPEQIKSVFLPYLPKSAAETVSLTKEDRISVIKDLKDQEKTLNALTAAVMGILADGRDLSGEDIIGICRLINFKLITGLLKQSSLTPDDEFYQNVVRKEFQKKDRTFELEKLQLIAGLFRRQLEDLLLTSVQVKWLVNSEPKLDIKLYGTGWEQDLSLKGYRETSLELFGEKYQNTVLQSKINLYPSLMLNNNSYLQPDLINGIAMGGFFLVNGSLVRTVGARVLEPFNGLLEVYQNREEMLAKVKFYMSHEAERIEKAERLRDHVLKNFGIEQVAKVILDAYREMG